MSFEEYLLDKHAEQYCGLDDGMNEDFEEWLQDLDVDSWINYGDLYAMNRAMDSLDNVEMRLKEGD